LTTLDRTRPYDIVGGLPGAAFSQDGRLFNPGGAEVVARVVHDDDAGEDLTIATLAPPGPKTLGRPAEVPDAPRPADGPDFAGMDHRKLKHMVVAYGGEYRSREQAIAFLTGMPIADAEGAA
jgi:hypothetical protein